MAFKEYMIKKELTGIDMILTFFIYFAAFILGFAMLLFGIRYSGLVLLVIVGLFYGAHMLSSRLRKEYEYICTDDCVDIDVIMNKSRRKRLISFDIASTEIIACVKDERYSDYLRGRFDKTIDATSGRRDADIYFAIVDKNGRCLVKFEPPYNMVSALSQFAKSKVHIYE